MKEYTFNRTDEEYKELAAYYALGSINIEQVEEITGVKVNNLPKVFVDEAHKIEEEYNQYCKEHSQENWNTLYDE